MQQKLEERKHMRLSHKTELAKLAPILGIRHCCRFPARKRKNID